MNKNDPCNGSKKRIENGLDYHFFSQDWCGCKKDPDNGGGNDGGNSGENFNTETLIEDIVSALKDNCTPLEVLLADCAAKYDPDDFEQPILVPGLLGKY